MKNFKVFVIGIICCIFLICNKSWATDYYTSPSGSGSTCSAETACAETYALTQASGGDTIYFLKGSVYSEVTAYTSGTAGNLITFDAYGSGSNNPTFEGIVNAKDYIAIQNILIDGNATISGDNNTIDTVTQIAGNTFTVSGDSNTLQDSTLGNVVISGDGTTVSNLMDGYNTSEAPFPNFTTTYWDENLEDGSLDYTVHAGGWQLIDASSKVGTGNLFEVINDSDICRGSYCLKYSLTGRNGLCNECGCADVTAEMAAGYTEVAYFIDSNGDDLSTEYSAAAGRIVYNVSDKYSRWEIDTVENGDATNDKLTLTMLAGPYDGTTTTNFSAGDTVYIMLECGVDGNCCLGSGCEDRRKDCNGTILWFNAGTTSQNAGAKIFRRYYVKFTTGTTSYGHKSRYWRSGSTNLQGYATLNSNPTPQMKGYSIAFDTWYCIEEMFQAESSADANDGKYALWIAPAGGAYTRVQYLTNQDMPTMTSTSLWGNHVHYSDGAGTMYFDDFKYADGRIGQ